LAEGKYSCCKSVLANLRKLSHIWYETLWDNSSLFTFALKWAISVVSIIGGDKGLWVGGLAEDGERTASVLGAGSGFFSGVWPVIVLESIDHSSEVPYESGIPTIDHPLRSIDN